jgi:transcriptional regulator with XRE-family HTH domain
MTDSLCSLDYGEDLVIRYRASGLTRREFAARAGISVSTLDYYVRRERKASLPAALPVNRILPVDLIAEETKAAGSLTMAPAGGVSIWLSNGRRIEVRRGFDAQLLGEGLAVLEAEGGGERA